MTSQHLLRLSQLAPHDKTPAAHRTKAHKKNFPILEGLSLYKLVLQANGIREPHWHPNADEMGYCLQGRVLINLYHTGDTQATFVVEEGDVFLIPSGALHHIENIGAGPAELLLAFSHEEAEDFQLSSALGTFTDAVLGNTWGVEASVFHALKRSTKGVFAAFREGSAHVPKQARSKTPFLYPLEKAKPLLLTEGGLARMARQNTWPIAERQALYSLRLTGEGMREPHWHPETRELGYIHKGHGRMSVLHPSGKVETYEIAPGDVYFIPKGYLHHIENLGEDELHILVFFDRGAPGDIGFTGSVSSYSGEVLGSVMGCGASFFEKLPHFDQDAFIVRKVNAVDG